MPNNEIKREHVDLALQEWRSLGRKEFMRKFRVEPAKNFWLVHDGMEIDGKALLRVAHKVTATSASVAKSNDTQSGSSAKAYFEALGFIEFRYEPATP
jgi:hypothetical protein